MLPPLTRRGVLCAAATLAASRAILPGGAHAAPPGPETPAATLGYVGLVDAAPLVVAAAHGLFAKHGMNSVRLVRQGSWGAVVRNLGGGPEAVDGAHLMTPLAYLLHTGRADGRPGGRPGGPALPMAILARLNTNGQAISVMKSLGQAGSQAGSQAGLDAAPLKAALAQRPDPVVAVTYRGGTHDLWMRYWLAAGGIVPDVDVQLQAAPLTETVENARMDIVGASSAGEPLNQQLVNEGLGATACVSGEIWRDHPEKSLAMRADWVGRHPRAALALTAAVIEAQVWADAPANRPALAALLAQPEWLGVPATDILPRLGGDITYGDGRAVRGSPLRMKFWADHASYPFRSHDMWFLVEGMRWGTYPVGLNAGELVRAVNREDVWRAAAAAAGAPADPPGTTRGVERFFDGKVFNASDPGTYLLSQPIRRVVG